MYNTMYDALLLAYMIDLMRTMTLAYMLEYVIAFMVGYMSHMHASRIRAATCTLSGFTEMHEMLVQIACSANLAVKEVDGDFAPQGWYSKAFCTNLNEALSFGGLDRDYSAANGNILPFVHCRLARDYAESLP